MVGAVPMMASSCANATGSASEMALRWMCSGVGRQEPHAQLGTGTGTVVAAMLLVKGIVFGCFRGVIERLVYRKVLQSGRDAQ